MTIRTRKLIGTIALLALIIVYSLLAMSVAVVLQMQSANKAVELIYYVVAGTLWVIPAGAIIWWMQQPGTGETQLKRN
jgi:peptidoglycan/LPS O-acetylase OafA/YrhL